MEINQPGGEGVTSINNLTGAVVLAAGTNITLTPVANTITIASTASAGGITSINTDTTSAQLLVVGTSGTNFVISDNGTGTHTFNLPTASATNTGKLSSTDWSTFNGKQAAGNYITALTGDVSAAGPGSVAATLATVNSNVGSFGSATQAGTFTVDAKGLVTAASNTTVTPAVGSITGLGTGVASFLATPSSANLASAVTDETGSGALVFATSPTLATPILGTPTSGTLTNCTGLPAASVVAGSFAAGGKYKFISGSDYVEINPSDSGGFPSIEMFNQGIVQAFLTAGSDTLLASPAFLMSVGLVVTGNLRATGKFQISNTIASAPTVWSPANNTVGVLELASSVGTSNCISFNEQGVAFRGTFGFPAGSSDFVYYSGGTGTFASGTETFRVTSGGNLSLVGKQTKYNNINTAGWGVPAIYGSGRSTAQTAAVGTVATYTVGAADGSFEVSANVNVTTATTHNFTVTCAYTDETNTAQTLTFGFVQLAGGTFLTAITNVTGVGPYESSAFHLRCKASTAITIATTGTFTAVTYNVEGTIKQII